MIGINLQCVLNAKDDLAELANGGAPQRTALVQSSSPTVATSDETSKSNLRMGYVARCNLARVVPAGGVCLQITAVPPKCPSLFVRTRACTCPRPPPRVLYVHRSLFASPSPAVCGEHPTTVFPVAISYIQLPQFVPTSGTLIIGFLIPRCRENEGARDVQITGRKRDKLCARAPRACG